MNLSYTKINTKIETLEIGIDLYVQNIFALNKNKLILKNNVVRKRSKNNAAKKC